jgi:hypothetical protein
MDPVIDEAGRIGFLATLGGEGVTPGSDSAVIEVWPRVNVELNSPPQVSSLLFSVVQENEIVPNFAEWDSFRGVYFWGPRDEYPTVLTEGNLRSAPLNSVGSNNNAAAGIQVGPLEIGKLQISVRERSAVLGLPPGEKVQSWKLFSAPAGSQGHGRFLGPNDEPTFTAHLTSGRDALLRIRSSETRASVFLLTGNKLNSTHFRCSLDKAGARLRGIRRACNISNGETRIGYARDWDLPRKC